MAGFNDFFSRSGHYPVIVLAYSVPTSMRKGAVGVTLHILWKRWPGVCHLVMLSLSQHQNLAAYHPDFLAKSPCLPYPSLPGSTGPSVPPRSSVLWASRSVEARGVGFVGAPRGSAHLGSRLRDPRLRDSSPWKGGF